MVVGMIISKAPLRVSFIGGGSDYPEFFANNQGAVLGSSIDKYVYVTVAQLSKFAEEKFRFTYRQTESVKSIAELQHPVVREALSNYFPVVGSAGLNLGTLSDLPGNSGLGSSSSFTVALLLALQRIQNYEDTSSSLLASQAVRIERELLKEPGGWQDQYHASFGGLRLYEFFPSGVKVGESLLNQSQLSELSAYFLLVKVGGSRNSKDFAHQTSLNVRNGESTDSLILQAAEAVRIASVIPGKSVAEVSELLFSSIRFSMAWKTSLGEIVVPKDVQAVGEYGVDLGASCYKLLGAGSSGYILFGADPKIICVLKAKFHNEHLDICLTSKGAEAIVF
jgi:D-glycero-alpha-D-manno-heptose-7-phosphate kinase